MSLQQVPTNVITGFLGVGKTTAILHLLQHKPRHERWAVLVNEFGEIGIDGSFFRGKTGESAGVFVREIAGGCMCCTAGLPLQIALNALLQRAKPDRLLIEPTGLGHPREVIDVLQSGYNAEVLRMQAAVCLLDARKLADPRYTEHPIFRQQIEVADILVANKSDLYSPEDFARWENIHGLLPGIGARQSLVAVNGQFSAACLSEVSRHTVASVGEPQVEHQVFGSFSMVKVPPGAPPELPPGGFVRHRREAEGVITLAWRFHPDVVFDRARVFACMAGLSTLRGKAVVITAEGVFGFNVVDGVLTELALDDCLESRFELIAESVDETWHDDILACVASPYY